MYKLMKVLKVRLALVMDKLISLNQLIFLKGRKLIYEVEDLIEIIFEPRFQRKMILSLMWTFRRLVIQLVGFS